MERERKDQVKDVANGQAKLKNDKEQFGQSSILYLTTHNSILPDQILITLTLRDTVDPGRVLVEI